jgi:hypothetical protein
MPRFFLHVCNGEGLTPDEHGAEFVDAEAARTEAIRSARSIMAEELQDGQLELGSFIDVEDENRNAVFRVRFADAVEIHH